MAAPNRLTLVLAILLAGLLLAFGVGAFRLDKAVIGGSAVSNVASTPVPAFKHIFIIVLENKSYDRVEGNSNAPYLNTLAHQYGLATNYYAIRHPSLPNYLALIGWAT